MGKKGKRRSLKRDFRQKAEDSFRDQSQWVDYSKTPNPKFESYYKRQGIVTDEEWPEFDLTARKELPVVFRINGRGPYALGLRQKLQSDFFVSLANSKNQSSVPPPRPLKWYPDDLAWQFEVSRRDLRRNPDLELLHEYIKHQTSIGSISRQEAVSMIPPLVLDIKLHHRVLDMCASPGSKTMQLLEMLHADQSELPTGFIVANDVDLRRCSMMTHQVRRMISPNIMMTCSDAGFFPSGAKVTRDKKGLVEFDRILADVPCSGDGTTRKNPSVWHKWKLQDGCGLHPLQLKIALRAAKLLSVGGLMVYSTCSLNPIEDEAVVAEVCRRCGGALQLVDLSTALPGLNVQRGKRFWIVEDDTRGYESYEEAVEYRNRMKKKLNIDPSFFPPGDEEDLPLERCIRVLPHMNDSGGFFVALLEKMKPVEEVAFPSVTHRFEACSEGDKERYRVERERKYPKKEAKVDQAEGGVEEGDVGRDQYFKGVDPILSLEGHKIVERVSEFYGVDGIDLGKNLISRNMNKDEPKKIYFISTQLKELIDAGWDKAIRITSIGQQVFSRGFQREEGTKYECIYRLSQEGLPLLLPYIKKQKMFLGLEAMINFLKKKTIKIQNPNQSPSEDTSLFVTDQKVVDAIRSLKQGGCVVLLDDEDASRHGLPLSTEAGAGLTSWAPIAVSAWLISPYTLNLMVPKEDAESMMQRLEEVTKGTCSPGVEVKNPRTET